MRFSRLIFFETRIEFYIMKTFITCASWKKRHADTVRWIGSTGIEKHGDDIEFHTGLDMRHLKIAEVLRSDGINVVFYIFMPFERNNDGILINLLDMGAHIIGLPGGYGEIIDHMASTADNLFTLDNGDALYRSAVKLDVPVWRPD